MTWTICYIILLSKIMQVPGRSIYYRSIYENSDRLRKQRQIGKIKTLLFVVTSSNNLSLVKSIKRRMRKKSAFLSDFVLLYISFRTCFICKMSRIYSACNLSFFLCNCGNETNKWTTSYWLGFRKIQIQLSAFILNVVFV